jgi:hypothetical protein
MVSDILKASHLSSTAGLIASKEVAVVISTCKLDDDVVPGILYYLTA